MPEEGFSNKEYIKVLILTQHSSFIIEELADRI